MARPFIPDEPLDLPPYQALIVRIERAGNLRDSGGIGLAWLAANAV